jgi:predicted metal-dependent hydrolase
MIRNASVFVILTLISIILFIRYTYKDVVYVKSDIDNAYYLVRDKKDKQTTANILAKIKKNMFTLVKYLDKNKTTNECIEFKKYIIQLQNGLQNVVINESSENSVYTSYSVNKGEQLIFCLRSKTDKGKIHDMNLLMYVVLHEMAHVGCPEYGHGPLFKKIFSFLVKNAILINLYEKIDFNTTNREYCGLMITDSII